MKTATRYWLFQVPGWVLTAGVLFALYQWTGFPLWAAAMVMVLLLVKDALLYPFLRHGYETEVKTGVEKLIGMRAVVKEPLNPQGLVQVAGELWRASSRADDPPVPEGAVVEIQSAKGLMLVVRRVGGASRKQ